MWPDLVLLQCSVPLLLQSVQLQHGCLQGSLLGQLLGHQLLLLGLSLRQRPLLLQVDLLQLRSLCSLLLQQPVMENTAMMLKISFTVYPLKSCSEQREASSQNMWLRVEKSRTVNLPSMTACCESISLIIRPTAGLNSCGTPMLNTRPMLISIKKWPFLRLCICDVVVLYCTKQTQ